ncbi:MAG: CHAP domain-containing protein [Clostridia bacterium]|nr:CHAP domain-containing protein [Clostridia bacterium]
MKRIKRIGAILMAAALLLSAMPFVVSAAYENTHTNTGNQPMDLVGVAKTQVGYREGASNDNKYSAAFGQPNVAWCGYFVAWCAKEAGIPTAILPRSGGASSYFDIGTYHARTSGYQPQTGDLILYGVYGNADHVGIVERFDATEGRVYVLDGNWSDQVSYHATTLNDTEVAGFVTPHYSSTVEEMELFNMSVPKTLELGSTYSIGGFVVSPYAIEYVEAVVSDEDGKTCLSRRETPNETAFSMATMDSALNFGELDAGVYAFTVTAKDAKKTKRWSYLFEVTVDASGFALRDAAYPKTLEYGAAFSVKGKLAAVEPITKAEVRVTDSNGKTILKASAAPHTKRFDFASLDYDVAFDTLEGGSYTYTLYAATASGEKQWDAKFTVTMPQTEPFVLDGATYPTKLAVGAVFSVKGTVKALETLTKAEVRITDQSGAVKIRAVGTPSGKSYDLAKLDYDVAFNTLQEGTYTYTIYAATASGEKQWEFPFTVGDPTTAEITLGGATYPTKLAVGAAFSVKGTVAASETLTKAEVRITDRNGAVKIRAVGTPNGKSYDLAKLDYDVTFNTLQEGNYTYTIYAATANGEKQWDFPFTVGDPPTAEITLSGATYPTTLAVGAAFSVKGTVAANETLTKAEVRITDRNGAVKIRAVGTPGGKSYDLAKLDYDVTFNTLAAGQYTYTIYAATANGEKQWDFPFTVGTTVTLGDIDGNQTINTMDALVLFHAASGAKELTASQEAAADVDENGTINMLDALALFAIASGR